MQLKQYIVIRIAIRFPCIAIYRDTLFSAIPTPSFNHKYNEIIALREGLILNFKFHGQDAKYGYCADVMQKGTLEETQRLT